MSRFVSCHKLATEPGSTKTYRRKLYQIGEYTSVGGIFARQTGNGFSSNKDRDDGRRFTQEFQFEF